MIDAAQYKYKALTWGDECKLMKLRTDHDWVDVDFSDQEHFAQTAAMAMASDVTVKYIVQLIQTVITNGPTEEEIQDMPAQDVLTLYALALMHRYGELELQQDEQDGEDRPN